MNDILLYNQPMFSLFQVTISAVKRPINNKASLNGELMDVNCLMFRICANDEHRIILYRLLIFSTKVHITRVGSVKGNFITEDRRENRSLFSATGPYANYCIIKHLVAGFVLD